MKSQEFIDIVTAGLTKKLKLKVVDKDGNWCDVGLDEEMPDKIYGYAIYVNAEFPTSFIAELIEDGLIPSQQEGLEGIVPYGN